MTTFITGATTSLGRVLVRELVRQGEAVRLLVQPESNRSGLELPGVFFIRGEITDAVSVWKGITGCDRVVHLLDQPEALSEAVLNRIQRDGTRNVLQAAQDLRVSSIVQVSSVAVLGPTQGEAAADETHAATRTYHPTWIKAQIAANEIAIDYAQKGSPVKIVYPGVGYGYVRAPGNSGLAEHTLLRMAGGKAAVIPGNGHQHLPVVYYKDLVEGIRLAHEQGSAGAGYLLVGEAPTWHELWDDVADLLNKPTPTRTTPLIWAKLTNALPADLLELAGHDWYYNSAKARTDLGWQPLSWHEGITATWDEIQATSAGTPAQSPIRAMRRA